MNWYEIMFKSIQRLVFVCVIVAGLYPQKRAQAQDTRLVTLNSLKARAMAMGGAFTALDDGLASLDFNPATFDLSASQSGARIRLLLNPIGLAVIKQNSGDAFKWDDYVGWIVHGVGFSFGRFSFGLVFNEELLGDVDRLARWRFFDGTGFSQFRSTSYGFSLRLASRVSLGLAGETLMRSENGTLIAETGYRYGVVLKPKPSLTVGVSFTDFPKQFAESRLDIERMADEGLNIGILYSPWSFFSIAFDVRNVSDEAKGAAREPHVGLEFKPSRRFSIQGGAFWQKDNIQVYSMGLGLLVSSSGLHEPRLFFNPAIYVHTAFLWQVDNGNLDRWFFLTTVLEL